MAPHPLDSSRPLPKGEVQGYDWFMRALGRVLQMAGLILLPLAIVLELTKDFGLPFTLKDMLLMLVFGAAVFYLGRVMEGYARQ